jgi:hypothetical protein
MTCRERANTRVAAAEARARQHAAAALSRVVTAAAEGAYLHLLCGLCHCMDGAGDDGAAKVPLYCRMRARVHEGRTPLSLRHSHGLHSAPPAPLSPPPAALAVACALSRSSSSEPAPCQSAEEYPGARVSWMWFTGGDHRIEPPAPPSSAISVKLRTPRLQLGYGDVDGRTLDAGVDDPAAWSSDALPGRSHVFSKHVIRLKRLNG